MIDSDVFEHNNIMVMATLNNNKIFSIIVRITMYFYKCTIRLDDTTVLSFGVSIINNLRFGIYTFALLSLLYQITNSYLTL